jgi:hypothetical protein
LLDMLSYIQLRSNLFDYFNLTQFGTKVDIMLTNTNINPSEQGKKNVDCETLM